MRKNFTREDVQNAATASFNMKVFLRRFFLKKSGRGVKGASSPLVAVRRRRNTLRHISGARGKGVRNATAFRGGSGQDRFPLVSEMNQVPLVNVPVGRLQRIETL